MCRKTRKGEEEKESSRVVVSCTFVNPPEKNRAKDQESRMKNKREIDLASR